MPVAWSTHRTTWEARSPTALIFRLRSRPNNKLYEEVAKQIERLILTKLNPGDKLPSERDLAEKLRVSRNSIRDAIRSLELMALVEPRQGRERSFAKPQPSHRESFRQRVEAPQGTGERASDFRKMFEPPLAARAAAHASAGEGSEMEEILRRQGERAGSR